MIGEETRLELAEHTANATQRIVAGEGITIALLDSAIQETIEGLVYGIAAVRPSPNTDVMRAHAFGQLFEATRLMSEELTDVLVDARSRVRGLATGQVEAEMDRVGAWLERDGLSDFAPALPDALEDAEIYDRVSAARAATSLASHFNAAATGAIHNWTRSTESSDSLPARLSLELQPIGKRVRAHAVSQAVDAYNAHTMGLWARARERGAPAPAGRPVFDRAPGRPGTPGTPGGKGAPVQPASVWWTSGEPRLPHGWGGAVQKVWSAVLDKATCAYCWDHDGRIIAFGKQFDVKWSYPDGLERPPIHPHCRCQIITFLVPELQRKKLPGIVADYEAMKADLSDYMRKFTVADLEGRGKRHAAEYISESLATNSPKTLTKRFLKRKLYFLP